MDERGNGLTRFLRALDRIYSAALEELRAGEKRGCWSWYIFPQLRGLGRSRKAFVYGIDGVGEAKAYLAHPLLRARLIECFEALLAHRGKTASEILGEVDALKLRSCATLFFMVGGGEIFGEVLERFFGGEADPLTCGLVNGTIVDGSHIKYISAFIN